MVAISLGMPVMLSACSPVANSASPSRAPVASSAETLSPAPPPTWQPLQKIATVVMSEDEKRRIRLEQLADLAKQSGLGSPEIPELVRWIYPEETGITLVPCLNGKGFAVTPNASGTGFSGNVGGAQDQAFALAEWECSAMYSIDSRITLPVTLAQWGVAYDYYAEFQLPCLKGLGYNTLELPSKEVFLVTHEWEGYPNGDETAETLCPHNPPTYVMFGEDSP